MNNKQLSAKSKKLKKDGQWTFLLVKDTGQIIQINHLKSLLILCLSIFIILVITTGIFYFLYHASCQKNKRLSAKLEKSYQQVTLLKNKNLKPDKIVEDLSKSKQIKPEANKILADNSLKKEPEPQISVSAIKAAKIEKPKEPNISNKQELEVLAEESDTKEKVVEIKKNLPVAIEDFESSYDKEQTLFKIKFKIKNTNPGSDSVSGNVIVVLKDSEFDSSKWLPMPEVELIAGRPTGREQGQTFTISYFKTLNFKAQDQRDPSDFKTAAIFILDDNGNLLMEQDISVEFKVRD